METQLLYGNVIVEWREVSIEDSKIPGSREAEMYLGKGGIEMEQKKILIIDDDPNLVASMSVALNGNSCCVVTASDGDDGLQKVINERPDLVIIDVITPVKHALKFCQNLRTEDRYRSCFDIPILLTYYPLEPFDPVQLREKVEHSIEVAQIPDSEGLGHRGKGEAAIYVKENIQKGYRVLA